MKHFSGSASKVPEQGTVIEQHPRRQRTFLPSNNRSPSDAFNSPPRLVHRQTAADSELDRVVSDFENALESYRRRSVSPCNSDSAELAARWRKPSGSVAEVNERWQHCRQFNSLPRASSLVIMTERNRIYSRSNSNSPQRSAASSRCSSPRDDRSAYEVSEEMMETIRSLQKLSQMGDERDFRPICTGNVKDTTTTLVGDEEFRTQKTGFSNLSHLDVTGATVRLGIDEPIVRTSVAYETYSADGEAHGCGINTHSFGSIGQKDSDAIEIQKCMLSENSHDRPQETIGSSHPDTTNQPKPGHESVFSALGVIDDLLDSGGTSKGIVRLGIEEPIASCEVAYETTDSDKEGINQKATSNQSLCDGATVCDALEVIDDLLDSRATPNLGVRLGIEEPIARCVAAYETTDTGKNTGETISGGTSSVNAKATDVNLCSRDFVSENKADNNAAENRHDDNHSTPLEFHQQHQHIIKPDSRVTRDECSAHGTGKIGFDVILKEQPSSSVLNASQLNVSYESPPIRQSPSLSFSSVRLETITPSRPTSRHVPSQTSVVSRESVGTETDLTSLQVEQIQEKLRVLSAEQLLRNSSPSTREEATQLSEVDLGVNYVRGAFSFAESADFGVQVDISDKNAKSMAVPSSLKSLSSSDIVQGNTTSQPRLTRTVGTSCTLLVDTNAVSTAPAPRPSKAVGCQAVNTGVSRGTNTARNSQTEHKNKSTMTIGPKVRTVSCGQSTETRNQTSQTDCLKEPTPAAMEELRPANSNSLNLLSNSGSKASRIPRPCSSIFSATDSVEMPLRPASAEPLSTCQLHRSRSARHRNLSAASSDSTGSFGARSAVSGSGRTRRAAAAIDSELLLRRRGTITRSTSAASNLQRTFNSLRQRSSPLLDRRKTFHVSSPLTAFSKLQQKRYGQENILGNSPYSRDSIGPGGDTKRLLGTPELMDQLEEVLAKFDTRGSAVRGSDALLELQGLWFDTAAGKSASSDNVRYMIERMFERISKDLASHIVNMTDVNGNRVVHYAASHNNLPVLVVLLNSQLCDMNVPNRAGYTCLMLLALSCRDQQPTDDAEECSSIILDRKQPKRTYFDKSSYKDGDEKTRESTYREDHGWDRTPCGTGDLQPKEIEEVLQQHEEDKQIRAVMNSLNVNAIARTTGQTALMLAATHNRQRMVRFLLESSADVNIQDKDGSTALMCAAEHGHTLIVSQLLSAPGCQLQLTDNDGCTAQQVALLAGKRHIAVILDRHFSNRTHV